MVLFGLFTYACARAWERGNKRGRGGVACVANLRLCAVVLLHCEVITLCELSPRPFTLHRATFTAERHSAQAGESQHHPQRLSGLQVQLQPSACHTYFSLHESYNNGGRKVASHPSPLPGGACGSGCVTSAEAVLVEMQNHREFFKALEEEKAAREVGGSGRVPLDQAGTTRARATLKPVSVLRLADVFPAAANRPADRQKR